MAETARLLPLSTRRNCHVFRTTPTKQAQFGWHAGCTTVPCFHTSKAGGAFGMTLEDVVTLSCLQPISADTRAARLFKELLDGPPGLPFEPVEGDLIHQLAARLGLPPEERPPAIEKARVFATEALARGRKAGLTPLAITDPGYPAWLRQIVDPPSVIWVKGQLPDLTTPAVAVVGSRHATPTARRGRRPCPPSNSPPRGSAGSPAGAAGRGCPPPPP